MAAPRCSCPSPIYSTKGRQFPKTNVPLTIPSIHNLQPFAIELSLVQIVMVPLTQTKTLDPQTQLVLMKIPLQLPLYIANVRKFGHQRMEITPSRCFNTPQKGSLKSFRIDSAIFCTIFSFLCPMVDSLVMESDRISVSNHP